MKKSIPWEQIKGVRLALTLLVLAVTFSLLIGCTGTPSVDALAAVSEACTTTEGQDHDIDVTTSSPGESLTSNIRFSANDAYHLIGHMTIDESIGMEPDSFTLELIEVDGNLYSKENGGEWNLTDDIPPGLFFYLDHLCAEVTRQEVRMVGSHDINSRPATLYISKESTPGSKEGATTISSVDTTTEYWVDSSGLLAKARSVQVVGAESGEGVRVEVVLLISGVGETNVITVPEVP